MSTEVLDHVGVGMGEGNVEYVSTRSILESIQKPSFCNITRRGQVCLELDLLKATQLADGERMESEVFQLGWRPLLLDAGN